MATATITGIFELTPHTTAEIAALTPVPTLGEILYDTDKSLLVAGTGAGGVIDLGGTGGITTVYTDDTRGIIGDGTTGDKIALDFTTLPPGPFDETDDLIVYQSGEDPANFLSLNNPDLRKAVMTSQHFNVNPTLTVGRIYTFPDANATVLTSLDRDDDDTFAANSATRVPSQRAVKTYFDNIVTGLTWKSSVRVASVVNGTLASAFANGQTVDGVTLTTGDRILIKAQTTGTENGLYIVAASGAPTRSSDADTGVELVGATMLVREGTVNADTQWTCTNNLITIGSTAVTFAQVSGAGTYSAGTGLSLSSNQFSIDSSVVTLTGTQTLTNKSIAATQLTGNLAIARFNSGTNASSSRFWRGDGSWETPATGLINGALNLASTLTQTFTSGSTTNNLLVTGMNRIVATVSGSGKAVLTGLAHAVGFGDGQVFVLENISGGRLQLVNGSGGSTVPFVTSTGEDVYLGVFEAALIVSNGTVNRVYPMGNYTKIGTIKPSAVTEYGWLECDGSAVSRTTYADLFAFIGTTFGAGNGSTTFNLPDARGRTLMGLGTGDHVGASNRTLGQKVGAETHTLTIAEMPAHTHPHGLQTGSTGGYGQVDSGTATSSGRPNTQSTGGGGAHNNMQPSLGMRYLIKW